MSVKNTSQVDGKNSAAPVKRRILNLLKTISSLARIYAGLQFLWIQVLQHQEYIDFCKEILSNIIA